MLVNESRCDAGVETVESPVWFRPRVALETTVFGSVVSQGNGQDTRISLGSANTQIGLTIAVRSLSSLRRIFAREYFKVDQIVPAADPLVKEADVVGPHQLNASRELDIDPLDTYSRPAGIIRP